MAVGKDLHFEVRGLTRASPDRSITAKAICASERQFSGPDQLGQVLGGRMPRPPRRPLP